MAEKKPANKFYYSTYSSDIYSEAQHSEKDAHHRKQDGKHVKHQRRHWSLNVLFKTRMIIILVSVVISSIFFSSRVNNTPKPEKFEVGLVIAPPSVFDIKSLQLPSVGSIVNKRVIFEDFIKNVKSEKIAKRFSTSNNYHQQIKIKRGVRFGESVDSLMISMIVKQPEVVKQWLDGFLSFAASQTIASFIKNSEQKIDDKKDEAMLKIDTLYAEAKDENKGLTRKIKRYKKASRLAKSKGIATPIGVDSLPKDKRFGDLLYLQGYWKLDAEIDRLQLILDKQVVDVTSEQQELKDLELLFPSADNLKAFSLEKYLKTKDLNLKNNQQAVWSVIGALIGLMLGLIISFPFRRKKVE
ncbi:MAG: hypothetical protein HAW67_04365 [Endozoicomonadaceae bacterium]|nr:hypothetical protein [Endozoicomonadaceae bacterium]